MQVEEKNSGAVIRVHVVTVHVEGPNEGISFFSYWTLPKGALIRIKGVHSPEREVAWISILQRVNRMYMCSRRRPGSLHINKPMLA